MSPRPTKYPQELREHAIRMFAEERLNYPSEAAAIRAVADRLGIRSPDTLRRWLRQSQLDANQKEPTPSKWQLLLRKWLLRPHTVISGVLVAILGGVGYFIVQSVIVQPVFGVGEDKVALQIVDTRISPAGIVVQNSTLAPFKIDIKLLNTGKQSAVIKEARLVVQRYVKLPQCGTQGDLPSTGHYRGNMPANPKQGATVNIPVSQVVPPNGADRFSLLLYGPPQQSKIVYVYRTHLYLLYNVGTARIDVGEMLIDVPWDPAWSDAYFYSRYFAARPGYFKFAGSDAAGIENCLIKNSKSLQSILSGPAARTKAVAAIPSELSTSKAR